MSAVPKSKHAGGRPKLPPGQARTVVMALRFTAEEHAAIVAAAE